MSRLINVDECPDPVREYIKLYLKTRVGDGDGGSITHSSFERYRDDMRWFGKWCLKENIDPLEMSEKDIMKLGLDAKDQFHGQTIINRLESIKRFHETFDESNPWEDIDVKSRFGLSEKSEESRHIEDTDSHYACTIDDIREMEKNVPAPRIRNQLILRTLWQTGLRSSEIISIKLDDINRNEREIKIRKTVTKNKKERIVAYQPSLDGLLNNWIDGGYRDRFRDSDSPYLLISYQSDQLTKHTIGYVVNQSAVEAGLQEETYKNAKGQMKKKITPHSIRHGFSNYLINETEIGIYELSKLLGHQSVEITEEIYVQHDERAGVNSLKKYGMD